MKHSILPLLFLTAILVSPTGPALAQTPVPESDTQSWNDVQLTIPLSKKVDFLIQGTLRIGGNLTKAVDERWGFGFNYKLHQYITLSESYVHREARPPNGRDEVEERLTLAATLRKPIGKFTLSDRKNDGRSRTQAVLTFDPEVEVKRNRRCISRNRDLLIARVGEYTLPEFVADIIF